MRTLISSLSFGAIAAATLASPAMAQDSDPAPFTGPRVGAILGYDATRPGSSEDSDISGDDQTADGLLYGGEVGYDFQVGPVVVGVEGEVAVSTAKVRYDTPDPADFGYGSVKAGRDLYAGARVGFLASPRTLVYAKGGYTNARFDLTASDGTTAVGGNFNLGGYRVGAGIEHSLSRNTYAKIEYRYSNYGNARLEYPNGATTDSFSVDTDRHQVAVGFGFRF